MCDIQNPVPLFGCVLTGESPTGIYFTVDSSSSWFKTYRMNNKTFAFFEPYHHEKVFSFLVIGTESAALIDTGMGVGNIRKEVERLTDLPVIVINTHGHFDHIGNNYYFKDIRCFDNPMEVNRIEKGITRFECAKFMTPASFSHLPAEFDISQYEIRPSKVTRRVRHLETVKLGKRELTIHHTPGHSPGSICLLDSRDGFLFTGDTYYPGTLFAHLDGSDFRTYHRSVKHLVTLLDQVSLLCPSHNQAHAPKEALMQLLKAFEQIVSAQIPYDVQYNTRQYNFKDFSLKTKLNL